jgi:hypothetical protein
MERTTETRKTLGQAIDELIQALEPLDDASRVTAIQAACGHLKIALAAGARAPGPSLHAPAPISETTLREEKQPSTASEMAALVAYYLAELASQSERAPHVTAEDVLKYFKQAGFPLPKARAMLLPNAKNAGYFDSLGDGKYRLNPVGYNLVAHNLPRSGTDSPTGKARKPRRAAKKKTKHNP